MNNTIHGKNNGKLEKQNQCKTSKQPGYMSHKIFDNNICKSKVVLKLNKPTYIGMCILNLSKVLMYEFHYDYIKNKDGNNSKLLFTDNESLTYEIKTEGVYEEFRSDKETFDFSNYSTKSKII